ncbi:site-specific integrase [Fulvimarina sp. 2208YS6-2-32]|uniref:Site-specific integrase n=1 Tax=Fulvimarina uroteuthidis TaxID=3098149 RepID=A0ABU5I5W7_9HYPH|nr:site-specific integrase [Fulvimarina sp. 2208YS6-2-32]MDY8110790.1 site-specific integrase [Fulvimarina sp. 2208YS6-2-32]
MKQARVLTDQEFRRLLAVIAQSRHGARNRLALMLSYQAGLRVGEIAALKLADVIDRDGGVRDQIRLCAAVTKGGHARVVFVNDRLRREIASFVNGMHENADRSAPLLVTQKQTGFSANTLCQLMARLYGEAGLDGATSHSGRRWFITRLAHSGVSAKVIMTLAGHKHLGTTQRYIDVNDDMMRAAVSIL